MELKPVVTTAVGWQGNGVSRMFENSTGRPPQGLMVIKQCRKCRAIKPISRFYFDRGTADKLSNRCKDCKRLYDAERRKLPHVKEYMRLAQRRRKSTPEGREEHADRQRIYYMRSKEATSA